MATCLADAARMAETPGKLCETAARTSSSSSCTSSCRSPPTPSNKKIGCEVSNITLFAADDLSIHDVDTIGVEPTGAAEAPPALGRLLPADLIFCHSPNIRP